MVKPKISIIGMGFVGLVSGACFANREFNVVGTSLNRDEVEMINKGITPFYEKDLGDLLEKAVKSNNIQASTDNEETVLNSDITFISVGTPMLDDKSIDLSYIQNCSIEIGKALAKKESYHLIVDRSTIVPGTTRNLIGNSIEQESGKKMGADFGLCMQPEFLREGNSVYDTFHPNRIIIGELDQRSGEFLENFWREFYAPEEIPILRMNLESAEMVKYTTNCLLATKVSYANEIANICRLNEKVDVIDVMKGVGLDDRITGKYLNSGPGFGGSCFTKDVNALISYAISHSYTPQILTNVLKVNYDQAIYVVDIAQELLGSLENKRVSLLGLSFKPNTDDMREAPSIRIIEELLKRKVAEIIGYDPKALESAERALGNKITYAKSVDEALKDSDCAILVTEWSDFKNLTPEDFKNTMKSPNLVDARRIFDFELFSKEIPFRAIGRK